MQVGAANQISPNYQNKQSFTAGINYGVYKTLAEEGADTLSILKKADTINRINKPEYSLIGVIYNAQEKIAEFLLSAENIKFIPGMENLKPVKVVSKGENISDAFFNINQAELEDANKALEKSIEKQLEETKEFRQAFYDRYQNFLNKLRKHCDEVSERYRKTWGTR